MRPPASSAEGRQADIMALTRVLRRTERDRTRDPFVRQQLEGLLRMALEIVIKPVAEPLVSDEDALIGAGD